MKLDAYRFADRRTGIGFARLDLDADQIAGVGRNVGKNFVRLSMLVPLDVIQRQSTDLILRSLIITPRLGVQELDFRHSKYAFLNLPNQSVLFRR